MIRTKRDRSRRKIAAACVLAAATAAGCASSDSDTHGRGPRTGHAPAAPVSPGSPEIAPKAVPGAADPQAKAEAAKAAEAQAQAHEQAAQAAQAAARQEALRIAREDAARRWGLDKPPLFPPAPPAGKPALASDGQHVMVKPGLPPIVRRVPTAEKVVFLTIDDGLEKDLEFNRMVRELGVPVSAFVTDYLARPNYGYFRELRDQGVSVHNHTINHKDLRKLDYEGQRREICNQQENLLKEIGTRPHLFRPPYGEYTDATLKAAASCGVTAVPLWNQEAFADRMEYRYGDRKFHPGDIILTHFRGRGTWRGSMSDMLRVTLREITAQGFALGRLEDYL